MTSSHLNGRKHRPTEKMGEGVFLGKPPAIAANDTGSYVEGSGNTQRRSST